MKLQSTLVFSLLFTISLANFLESFKISSLYKYSLIKHSSKRLVNHDAKKNITDLSEQKLRGVSLGGWLVLEPWITPSMFESAKKTYGKMPVDEYTFTSILGKVKAQEILSNHWSSFYTEADFHSIKDLGLNLVRIPIGYWAFGLKDDDPYIQGQEYYLDKAIEWAKKYDLKVQIDIHGMPGSQNGFDNSGKCTNEPNWLETEENMNLTYKVLDYFLEKYKDPDLRVHSLEVVNEPFGAILDLDKLEDFYEYAYDLARSKGVNSKMTFHDGFLDIGSWNWFMVGPEYNNITIDHHLYEIFSEEQVGLDIDDHLYNIESQGFAMKNQSHPCIVGEFSAALTDCTKYINGVGKGSRFDGTFQSSIKFGSCENHTDINSWSETFKKDTKKFLQAQIDTFEDKSEGWIFWCYKTENAIEWDYRVLAELNFLPERLTTYVAENTKSLQPESKTSSNAYEKEKNQASFALQNFQLKLINLLFSLILTIFT